MARLAEKVAIVTGSGAVIGKAAALLFAEEGASVAVLTRSPKHGEETVRTLRGGTGTFTRCDVSSSSEIRQWVKRVLNTYGRRDVLFNNAGAEEPPGDLKDLNEEGFDRAVAVNLKSVFLVSTR